MLPGAFRSDPGVKPGGQSDGMARVTVERSVALCYLRARYP